MSSGILVIEDDPDIRELVTLNLRDLNFEVDAADDGEVGYRLALEKNYDLIVLDLMLPGLNGLEVCRRLRSKENFTPILMLTALNSETDRVVGLEMGADDYLVKPFSVRELQARVKALLRRMEQLIKTQKDEGSEQILRASDLLIDLARREVRCREKVVELTSTEFDLLSYLARRPGHVFSRAELLDKVWGYHHSGYEHTVNSHINRLRTKIEKDPSQPEYVLTVWGVGYKFCDL
jgi:two-component system alkaline phosphatase synthesis response regulator PhoP